ncbi:MAG TPA: hypothetical protein VEP28_02490 [Rubrobacter sp.]|nr:hypothetical protein [Rubrobacter sp.]
MRTITLRCGHGGGDGRPCNRVEGVFLVEGNLLTLTRWGGLPTAP